jgi:hypothetical protein
MLEKGPKSGWGMFIILQKLEQYVLKVHCPLPLRWTLLGAKQNFLRKIGFMGIKRRRILLRFQKCKLALVTKCTLKWYLRINK